VLTFCDISIKIVDVKCILLSIKSQRFQVFRKNGGQNMMHSTELAKTRDMFKDYLGYTEPMSYVDWLSIPSDHKAAVLFVQFYEQITLAWYKLYRDYVPETDIVEVVMQYLCKNVAKIEDHPERFSESYIYTVVYNCIGCLTNRNSKFKTISDNECIASCIPGMDETTSIFDLVPSYHDTESQNTDSFRESFWRIIESKGHETIVVVSELLGDRLDWTTYLKNPSVKPKRISVWESKKIDDAKRLKIIEDLRTDLIRLLGSDTLESYV